MYLDTLYLDIKDALVFFGLKFSEMGCVKVELVDGKFVMSYNGRYVAVDLSE